MGIRNFFVNTVKKNTNVRGWMGWSAVKENARVVTGLATDISSTEEKNNTSRVETFDQAVQRLGLSQNEIEHRMQTFRRVGQFCGVLGFAAFIWGMYILFKGMFLSSLMAFSLSCLMFIYGFREHFHYFQMKQRRLDCTVKEWFSSFISKK